ncbi:MAG TPA: DUF4258 domain-containing protein [Pararobbsia sp.]|nr:DUF4258 domain-containing protein [Pararobbsia sp.]
MRFQITPIKIMGMGSNLLPFKLDDNRLRRFIAEIAVDTARVFITDHAKRRMRERRIRPTQIYDCLRRGQLKEPGFINLHGHWQCTLMRKHAGDPIHAVAVLERDDDGDWIAVVTAF